MTNKPQYGRKCDEKSKFQIPYKSNWEEYATYDE